MKLAGLGRAGLLLLVGSVLVLGGCGDDVQEVSAPELRAAPSEVNFPPTQVLTANRQLVTLENVGTGTLVITDLSIRTHSQTFQLEAPDLPIELDEGSDAIAVTVVYTPQSSERVTGTLQVRSNGGNADIPLQPQDLAGIVFVAPDPITFGRVPAGDVVTTQATLQNIGTAPLNVNNLFITGSTEFTLLSVTDSDGAEVPIPFTLDPAAFVTMNIEYSPETDGFDQAVLVVRSDDRESTEKFVDIIANGAEPCISVTHEEGYDFGERLIGRTHSETFTITNCSDAVNGQALLVDTITFLPEQSDPAFELGSLPGGLNAMQLELAPQASESFTVNYTPTEEVSNVAMLRIESNDAIKSPLDIEIRGVGSFNVCPVAVARCRVQNGSPAFDTELTAIPLDTIECDGSMSTDEDGAVASHQWEVIERPEGSTAPFQPSSTIADPTFFVDLAGRYVFRLNVVDDDGALSCEPADVTIIATPDEDIHVQLVWSTAGDLNEGDTGFGAGSDVDLHLLHPNGSWEDRQWDCHFRAREPNWGDPGRADDDPSLDIDDTDGAGPENIDLNNPEDGVTYRVGVHYWDDHGFGESLATLRLYIFGLLQFEIRDKPLPAQDYFWDVAAVRWPEAEIIRIDQVTADIP